MYSSARLAETRVVLLGGQLLVVAQHGLLLAIQLGLREAELRDALGLGDQRVEPALDPVLLDHRRERRLVLGAAR